MMDSFMQDLISFVGRRIEAARKGLKRRLEASDVSPLPKDEAANVLDTVGRDVSYILGLDDGLQLAELMIEKDESHVNGARFITPGVAERVPVDVQRFLWHMIDKLKEQPDSAIDYLQVFELKPGKTGGQVIRHFQEVPRLEKELRFDNVSSPLTVKVYVIDDGGCSTMLLSEER